MFLAPIFFNSLRYEVINGLGDSDGVFDSVGEPNKHGIGINPPNCTILDDWVFESFILADEAFAKALQSFETSVSVKGYLCWKTILCHKVTLDVQLMNLKIWRKK